MFSAKTYTARRHELRTKIGSGIILLPSNSLSPNNYPNNAYYFRQDSSFRYYFGLNVPSVVGVIDADTGEEALYGDDFTVEDIIWTGPQPTLREMGAGAGVTATFPMAELEKRLRRAISLGRRVHYLPPYRGETKLQLSALLGIKPALLHDYKSVDLMFAVAEMREKKSAEEVEEMERAFRIGYEMHTTAMRLCRPGVSEQYIAGTISGIASAKGCMTSFPTILSMHGEIMHGYPSPRPLEDGRLMLCDAGAETNENYCSDNTRTTPINGRFTSRQRDIYSIVEACHDHVLDIARPGVKWWDVHMSVARLMTERLKELGLMKGDTEEAVRNGAHAMFFPHGLGHMMGMDVHDMEGLGQRYVGFDEEVQPSTQFGTNCLRCGRRLQEGWVMTDEPGIYFIPALIDEWKSKGIHKDFINFDLLETYKDFGGIRIEDDILITASGCRMLGHERIPYHMDDVEEFMAQRTN